MVFVEMSSNHARVYLKILASGVQIDCPARYNVGRMKMMYLALLTLVRLPFVATLHSGLIELDAFRTISKVRCTYEEQKDGRFVFIFS